MHSEAGMKIEQPPIITTDQWGARPAKVKPVYVSRPKRIIFHHTAGHHPEISVPRDESRAEAIAYARAIQRFHMDVNGWNDSGHNFLVCRNGLILVGRHMSLPAIKKGRMVLPPIVRARTTSRVSSMSIWVLSR